jgi:hypothetical protein
MKASRDLNLPEILKMIAGKYVNAILITAFNRVIRPETIDLISEWYEDSYISTQYTVDVSSAAISRAMTALGRVSLKQAFLSEIIKKTGKSGALY